MVSGTTNEFNGLQILQRTGSANDSGLAIDDLQVSVTATPEPASLVLLSAGAFLAGVARLRKRRQQA